MNVDVTSLFDRRADNRWERINLGDILERNIWGRPEKEAIIGWHGAFAYPQHERLTYQQANSLQNQVANGLIDSGLERGDRVVLFCENSVEAYIAKYALAKAGLVGAPFNPNLAPDMIDILLDRLQPRFVIADAELAPRLIPSLERAGIKLDVTIPIGGGALPGSVEFGEFISGRSIDEPDVVTHGDDIWEILFTSGTTAAPKGAMMSHTSTQMAALGFAASLSRGLRRDHDLVLATFLPVIYHVANHIYALPAWTAGGTLVIGRRPDGRETANAIETERVTALWGGNPLMLTAVVEAAEEGSIDLTSLTFAGFGWAAISPDLYQRFKARASNGFQFMTHLGQTEAISCLRFYLEEDEEKFLAHAPTKNFVGRSNPMLASRVIDADGQSIEEPDIAGEVVFRSPVITSGYYLDEAATEEAFEGGWFHSGDSCVMDGDGVHIMVDRYKDIVKTGGENVSSVRVETVLQAHTDVLRAAVVGLPHETWGEAVTAVVVPRDGAVIEEAALIAHCKESLAGYETPKSIVVVSSLPETVGGKLLKYKLRAEYSGLYDGR